MKYTFKLSDITTEKGKIGNVEATVECSISEMIAVRQEFELALSNLPMYLRQIGEVEKAYDNINEELDERYELNIQKKNIKNVINKRLKNIISEVASEVL